MRKKIICLSLITLSIIALSACNNNSVHVASVPNPDYDNNLTKGNNVDSINIDYYDSLSSSQKQITISKEDTYFDMVDKLSSAGYTTTFDIRKKTCNEISSYVEKATMTHEYDLKNVINYASTKNEKGERVQLHDQYTYGDVNYIYSNCANTTSYIHNKFITGSKCTYERGESKYLNDYYFTESKDDDYNKGLYYNHYGNDNEGYAEIATDMNYNGVFSVANYSESRDNLKNYGSLYFKTSWDSNNNDIIRYKAEDIDLILDEESVKNYSFRTPIEIVHSSDLLKAAIFSNTIKDDPDYIKRYYEYNFELTDKYLIIKNKINLALDVYNQVARKIKNYTKEEFEEELKKYKDSYYIKEVWINYKDYIIDDNNNYVIGYDYYKESSSSTFTQDIIYTKDNTLGFGEDVVNKLGLIGKTNKNVLISKKEDEIYTIDIDNDTINKKMEDFINKCKENNVFDKWNFKPYMTTHYMS